MAIRVLDAAVYWADGYENSPHLTFLLDRKPDWGTYEKRPCAAERLSTEQAAIVGGPRQHAPAPGWHIYHAEDDGFATFFTWGGKADDGFGGWRRTITLIDGGTEEVVGGWHVGPGVAIDAGFPPCVDAGIRTDRPGRGPLGGGIACFITEDRCRREVAAHLPDVEVCRATAGGGLTVKWRGQQSKADFMAIERGRRETIRTALKAKYHDGSRHGGDWYRHATNDERAALQTRPYSALGATAVAA